jgi:prophage tail gpP-like protein
MLKITFITNNIEFTQWKKIQIFKSINTITGSVVLFTPSFYKGKTSGWNLYIGDEYELKVNNATISKGIIDKIIPIYGFDSNNLPEYKFSISCRDKTSLLVDSTYTKAENEWKNETAINIIRRICSAYNIEVAYEKSIASIVNNKIDNFKHNEGDFASTSIIRLTNEIGVLPISYGDNKLTIIKGTTNVLSIDAIEIGANVKYASSVYSNIDRYSNYIVKGTGIGSDEKQLIDFIEPYGEANDPVITSYKPFIIFSDVPTDNGKCQIKAKWERNIRAGNSRKRTYVMNNWIQTNKNLWMINTLARVKDWHAEIDQQMLITDAIYNYDSEKGSNCILSLVNKDTYSTNDVIIKGEYDR